jgi:hypothetical protein
MRFAGAAMYRAKELAAPRAHLRGEHERALRAAARARAEPPSRDRAQTNSPCFTSRSTTARGGALSADKVRDFVEVQTPRPKTLEIRHPDMTP